MRWHVMQTPPSTPPSSGPLNRRSDLNMSLSTHSDLSRQQDFIIRDLTWNHISQPNKTKEYMDSLLPPSPEDFKRIAHIQEQKEEQLRQRDKEHFQNEQRLRTPENQDVARAVKLIQRMYRGHRARREMNGFGLDASTRWVSALREAEFRHTTRPMSRASAPSSPREEYGTEMSSAKRHWKKASMVARRAGHDDVDSDSSSLSEWDAADSPGDRQKLRQLKEKLLADRRHQAQMMGLQYFLEMVDTKHRYGSNLRMYHEEWKKLDTTENFFYWLDSGEGKNIELDACPRDRLEREKIRYLSREERQYYLVKVDNEGRLRWAKNGQLLDTSDKFKDSIHGIVPVDDHTPPYDPAVSPRSHRTASRHSRISSMLSFNSVNSSVREADRAAKYTETGSEEAAAAGAAGGMQRITHISATTIWNKLLRRSVRDGTWIFVADTSFRLYVGIKNSGAFQHSSFLQGGRISAAGLIWIKDGRITSLSPLSGHYRPPASNFRAFVRSLKEGGVDMSHVSISKSYVVLVGLEAYLKTRKKGEVLLHKVLHGKG